MLSEFLSNIVSQKMIGKLHILIVSYLINLQAQRHNCKKLIRDPLPRLFLHAPIEAY